MRHTVHVYLCIQGEEGTKIEYRVWNPFRSKLAAAILGGVGNIYIKPGAKVLYLGAASGTTVSHVADIVGSVCLCVCVCVCVRACDSIAKWVEHRPGN